MQWMLISEKVGVVWGVDLQLIMVIIVIELGGNFVVVSKFGVVGLMQFKLLIFGCDVYWWMGWCGELLVSELKNLECNILMGVVYLSILENGLLVGIKDLQVMCYVVVVFYVNGVGVLLCIFFLNCQDVIEEINDFDVDEFFEYVVKKYLVLQVLCYIWKLQKVLDVM